MRLLGACPNGLVHHGAFLPPYPGLRTVAYNVVPNRAVTTPAGVHQVGTQPHTLKAMQVGAFRRINSLCTPQA